MRYSSQCRSGAELSFLPVRDDWFSLVGGAPGDGVPRIGNDVMLGAGCVLLGDIEVGDGAVVGANAVVTKSAPAGCVALGGPANIGKIN